MRLAQFLGLAAALAGLVFLARQARPSQPRWIVSLLVVTWLGVTYLNIAGALGPSTALRNGDGGRYFLFGELCFLILLLWVSKSDKAWIGRGATFLLAWACVTGVIFRIGGVRPLIANQGPAWGAQISACRAEPNNPCRVRIFPAYYPQDQWWLSVPAERLKQ